MDPVATIEQSQNDILIIDDNDNSLESVRKILIHAGYKVRHAHRATLVHDTVQLPDCILLNVQLSDMDGFEACRRLKADERTRAVPVILMCGSKEAGTSSDGFAAGAVDFIAHPFKDDDVLARVAAHLAAYHAFRDLERKNAEGALRESNELFSLFIRKSPIYSYIKEVTPARSIVLQASDNYSHMIGIPGAEMAGKTMAELFPAEFAAKITADDWAIVTKGEMLELEEDLNGRNYTTIKFPIVLGNRTLLAGYTFDITDRKTAERANQSLLRQVQEEKERLALLVGSMLDEVWFADTSGHFTLANPSACAAFNLENCDSLDVQQFAQSLEVFRPDGSPRPVQEAPPLRALAGETVIEMEEIVRLPRSGELRYRLVNCSPVKDSAGKVIGCVSVVRDITERKELQWEVSHMASFPAQNPNPVLEIGIDGTVRFANAAATELLVRLGLGSDVRQFLPEKPEELALLWSLCARKPQTQEIRLGEATVQRVLSAPDKDILRIYVSDITELKKAEEEIHVLNAELEERVLRRTVELTAANKELDAFSYSVSHDLRSPLRSIEGFSAIFLEEYGAMVPERGRGYLERVRRNALRMGQLIDDLLKLSRVISSELSIERTDVSALAAEVAGELANDNPQRDVRVLIEPGMSTMCDLPLMRVVFTNLLGNAWKFTSKREHAHVSVGTVMDPHRGTAFFVRDDGVGFNEEYKKMLFGAFQRLHSDKEFTGTGIGLATVARIIHRHGGEVWAESEVDKGAAFYFTIPDPHR